MIGCVAIWFGGFTGMLLSTTAEGATVWGRIALMGVCLLPASIYDFTTTALRLYSSRKFFVNLVWILGAGFAMLAALTNGIVAGVTRHRWGFYPYVGPLTRAFLLIFFAVLIAQIVEGTLEYRRTTEPKRKRRIANLMLSFVVVYFAAVDFLPMFGVEMKPVGYIPVVAFVAFAWSTIARHRFQPVTAARAADRSAIRSVTSDTATAAPSPSACRSHRSPSATCSRARSSLRATSASASTPSKSCITR